MNSSEILMEEASFSMVVFQAELFKITNVFIYLH